MKLSRHYSWQTGDLSVLGFKIFHVMTWSIPPVVTAVQTVPGPQSQDMTTQNRSKNIPCNVRPFSTLVMHQNLLLVMYFGEDLHSRLAHCGQLWMREMEIAVWCLLGLLLLLTATHRSDQPAPHPAERIYINISTQFWYKNIL